MTLYVIRKSEFSTFPMTSPPKHVLLLAVLVLSTTRALVLDTLVTAEPRCHFSIAAIKCDELYRRKEAGSKRGDKQVCDERNVGDARLFPTRPLSLHSSYRSLRFGCLILTLDFDGPRDGILGVITRFRTMYQDLSRTKWLLNRISVR